MSRLTLYTVFHCNLSFSAIPAEDVPLVVARCYHPLLDLCEREGLPLGVEVSGSTLLAAERADPRFVERLVSLVREGRAEIVGSGLSQVILPLVPAEVNRANLSAGMRLYRECIGRSPRIAYLNEQVWSDGLPRLYREVGFEALIADWWNASVGSSMPEDARYRPVSAMGADGESVPVLWNDTEIFQKVQRYAHGRLTLDDLLDGLASHIGIERRALPLYGGDAEIFDYRPGRDLFHHPDEREGGVEYGRLGLLVRRLREDSRFDLALPSEVLRRFPPAGPALRLADAAYPVRTKKQPKYNVTRWAVTGRADTAINTRCFQAAYDLRRLERLARLVEESRGEAQGEPLLPALSRWREQLVELWSSDYRTHITDRRFDRFSDGMGELTASLRGADAIVSDRLRADRGWTVVNVGAERRDDAVVELACTFHPGNCSAPRAATVDGQPAPCQWEDVTRYASGDVRDAQILVRLSLDAGERAVVRFDGPLLPALEPVGGGAGWSVDTGPVRISMWREKPGTVDRLTFPGVSPDALVGTVRHGELPDVDLLADLFTGHLLIIEGDGRQVTDLDDVSVSEPIAWAEEPLRRSVEFRVTTSLGELRKRYHVSCVEPVVELEHAFNLRGVQPVAFRLGVVTFLPDAFDRASLAYRTVNGGRDVERFPLAGRRVEQDAPVSVRVSARHCLGATEGWVDVLDDTKGLRVSRAMTDVYSVPLVHYEEVGGGPLAYLRVLHTVAERDETLTAVWKGRHTAHFRWEAFRPGRPPADPRDLVVIAPR